MNEEEIINEQTNVSDVKELKLKSWHVLGLFLLACFFPISDSPVENNKDAEIRVLEARVSELQKKLEAANESIDELNYREADRILSKVARINANSTSYVSADTNLGKLFFSVEDVQPYGNGYKLVLLIGNPNSAVFTNAKLHISYGQGDIKQERAEVLMNPIYSSRWNKFEIILPYAEKSDLDSIMIKPELNIISFR